MKRILITFFCLTLGFGLYAQTEGISINTNGNDPDASAMLDIQSENKGLLMPRMTKVQRNAIPNPAPGLMIYNLDDSCFNYYSGEEWVLDCGRVSPLTGNSDFLQSTGETAYQKAYDLDFDQNGNLIIVGGFKDSIRFANTVLVNPKTFVENFFVVKYDLSGTPLWVLEGTSANSNSAVYGMSVATDQNNNIYISGYTEGNLIIKKQGTIQANLLNPPNVDGTDEYAFWLKFSPAGDLLDNGYINDISKGYDITTNNNGRHAMTGFIEDGGSTMFVSCYSDTGSQLWRRQETSTLSFSTGREVSMDAVGNTFVTGYFQDSLSLSDTTLYAAGGFEAFVLKYSPGGNLLWAQQGGGPGNDKGRSIDIDANGNCYVAGTFQDTIAFDDTTLSSLGEEDIFIAKFDAQGTLIWAKSAGGSNRDFALAIEVNPDGTGFLGGYFWATASFDALPALTSSGNEDAFVSRFDADGNFSWAVSGGGTNYDQLSGISINPEGNVFATGSFYGTASFGGQLFTSKGSSDMFVWPLNKNDATSNLSLSTISDNQDGDTDASNEIQNLSLNGALLSISDGDTIDLSGINTDNQALSLSGTQLSISNGNGVDLASIDTDTDDQTLSLSGSQLSIADGNSIDIGIAVDGGKVGIGTTTPNAPLSVVGIIRAAYDTTETEFTQIGHGGGSGYINTVGDGNLDFRHDGTTMMTVTDQKRLGIGTNTPEARLHIKAPSQGAYSGLKLSAGQYNAEIYLDNGDLILKKGNQANQLVLDQNGNIGIGTATPYKGMVEIDGYKNHMISAGYGFLLSNGNTGPYTPTQSYPYSLYASDRIAASEFNAHSDIRIKDIQGISDSKVDLERLMQIEITDYRLKDTLTKGRKAIKKVIAQQVADVYPQAVTNNLTEVVPDIYQKAAVENAWIMLATDLKPGEKVKIITEEKMEMVEVVTVEAERFKVDSNFKNGQAFIYGREVHDFHTVDYEAISMLNVSATQEQQRLIEEQERMINTQQTEIDLLKKELEQMKSLLMQKHIASDQK